MEHLAIDEYQLDRPGRYIIITPMRNEIKSINSTINSVLNQTCMPKLWLIIDDGSTDGSSELVDDYAAIHRWIIRIPKPDRGFDFVGKGVADILNYGFGLVKNIDIEFISKLDADLSFAEDYFERLLAEMDKNPLLGIISGVPYIIENNKKTYEWHSDYFPSGTARLYRKIYLREIGSFVSSVGWDTVDILRMKMRGYDTKVDNSTEVHHMRPMGTRKSYYDGMIRDGRNNYITGYSSWFFLLRSLYNANNYPYLIRTICMLYGYLYATITRMPRAVTEEERKFHVQFQMNRIKKALLGAG